MIKLTDENQKELIPDEEIHNSFLQRKDIKKLKPELQEKRWKEHLKSVNRFRESLRGLSAFIIEQ